MTEFEIAVLAALERIGEALERPAARKSNLLKIIFRHVGSSAEFTAAELVRFAALPAHAALQAALDRDFDDPEPRRIGRFLAAIAGREVNGFTVENVGTEREGILWRVVRVRLTADQHALPVAHEESAAHAADSFEEGVRKCASAR